MKTDAPPTSHVLEYGSRRIPYELSISDRKKLRIVVHPDLSVDVHAPTGYSHDEITKVILSKGRWLVKQLNEVAAFHPLPGPYRFLSGETFLYLGRQYRLRVSEGEKRSAKLKGKYLEVVVPDKKDAEAVQACVTAWYRERADDRFGRIMTECLKMVRRHGSVDPSLSIRRMKTRWGSCSATGRVTLNLYLIQVPVHCIEYVVMHELCHLIEHNHSRAFYRLLTMCLPDWEKRKKELNQFAVNRV